MFGYVYMVTNKVNNKMYIGKHKSTHFDEEYLGSGTVLLRAKEKYGIENFESTLIEECNSLEELNEREKYWIAYYDATNSDQFYNVLKGGDGGFDYIHNNLPHSHLGKHLSEEAKSNISKALSGKKKSDSHKQSLSRSRKESGMAVGEKNPNYGKLYYTNGVEEVHIREDEVPYYESIGYYKGRPGYLRDLCTKATGTKWYTNGEKDVRVKGEDIPRYIELGFVPGRRPKK